MISLRIQRLVLPLTLCLVHIGCVASVDKDEPLGAGGAAADQVPPALLIGSLASDTTAGERRAPDAYAESFSSGVFRFHEWKAPNAQLLRLRIDTFGTFEPRLLVYAPVVISETPSRTIVGPRPFWVVPKTRSAGVYEALIGLRAGRPLERGASILLTSADAAAEPHTAVDPTARYELKVLPIDDWAERPIDVACTAPTSECTLTNDGNDYAMTFDEDRVTVAIALQEQSFVTSAHLLFANKAYVDLVRAILPDDSERRLSLFDWETANASDGLRSLSIFAEGRIERLEIDFVTDDLWYGDLTFSNPNVVGLSSAAATDLHDLTRATPEMLNADWQEPSIDEIVFPSAAESPRAAD